MDTSPFSCLLFCNVGGKFSSLFISVTSIRELWKYTSHHITSPPVDLPLCSPLTIRGGGTSKKTVTHNKQFINSGSGWSLNRVLSTNVELGKLYIRGRCQKEATSENSTIKNVKRNIYGTARQQKLQSYYLFVVVVSQKVFSSKFGAIGGKKDPTTADGCTSFGFESSA